MTLDETTSCEALEAADEAGLAIAPPSALPPAATPAEVRRVFFGIMIALTLASLDGNIVGPALPRIVSDLGGLSHLSWVVTAFALASTAVTPLYGKLSDQYGRRPAFFVSIGLFLLGSTLCGAAHSMAWLIGARALQGLGAGGLVTLSQTTIADVVPPRERGRYQGTIASVFAICSIAGPLLGGVITDWFTWPWIFYINLPIGAVAVVILALFLRPHQRGRSLKIDLPGFALLIGGTCTGLLALSWGGTAYPWVSAPVLGLAAATALQWLLLVPVEMAAAEPALPPRLFRNRVFLRGVAGVSLGMMAMFGALVFVPLFFQVVHGASATEAGLRMAPNMGGLIVTSMITGRLVSRTGRYKIYPLIGLSLSSLCLAGMSLAAADGASANIVDLWLIGLGGGMGMTLPNVTTAIQNAVAIADLGVATGTSTFFRSLGVAFGVAMSGTILAVSLHATLPAGEKTDLTTLGLAQIRALPLAMQTDLSNAYGHAQSVIFAAAALCTLAALGCLATMPELPLRGRNPGAADAGA
jgi:EmrB/QacA subfamily drug resistance transporter